MISPTGETLQSRLGSVGRRCTQLCIGVDSKGIFVTKLGKIAASIPRQSIAKSGSSVARSYVPEG